MTHELKTWPGPFNAVWNGLKRFEFRKDDRSFLVGDVVRLREWDPELGEYSGNWIEHAITYVARGPAFGIPDGYVVMSLGDRLAQDLPSEPPR